MKKATGPAGEFSPKRTLAAFVLHGFIAQEADLFHSPEDRPVS
jgi:hypothetical protein